MEVALSRRIALYAGVGASQVRELQEENHRHQEHRQVLDKWVEEQRAQFEEQMDTGEGGFRVCSWCGVPFNTTIVEDDWGHSCGINEFQECSWYCRRPSCNAPVHDCAHCNYLTCSECAKECEKCGEVICNNCSEHPCEKQE